MNVLRPDACGEYDEDGVKFVSKMRFYLKHFNLDLRHQHPNISEILKEKVDLKSW